MYSGKKYSDVTGKILERYACTHPDIPQFTSSKASL